MDVPELEKERRLINEETIEHLDTLFENLPDTEIRCLLRVEGSINTMGKGMWWTPDIIESCEMYYADAPNSNVYAFLTSDHILASWVKNCAIQFRGGFYLHGYTNFKEFEEHNDNIMPYYIIENPELIKSVKIPNELIINTYKSAKNEFPFTKGQYDGMRRFSMMQKGEQEIIRAIRNWRFFMK
jgi:hypothetical protein